jgi:putative hydrolase of the HAD superfamily
LPSLKKQFEGFFDVITLSYEHGYVKQHPSIFVTTLEKLKASPNQSLHVGDDPIADIQGARSIGMKTVFIKRKGMKTNADMEIRRIRANNALLKRQDASYSRALTTLTIFLV